MNRVPHRAAHRPAHRPAHRAAHRPAHRPAHRAAHRAAHLVVALALSAVPWQATATTYRLMTPTEILLAADLVFYGTVSDVVTENRAGEAWTLVTLRVDELLVGFGYDPSIPSPDGGSEGEPPVPQDPAEVAPESVTLAFLGGSAAGAELLVSGTPTWRFEESFLVAAYEQEGLASPLVGFRQGLWRIGDEGMVDLDGSALAVAEDGSPVRAQLGSTTSQVVRAVQGVLSGNLTPAEPTGEVDLPQGSAQEPAPAGEPAGEGVVAPQDEPPGAEPQADPLAEPQVDEPVTVPTSEADYDVDDSGGPLLLTDKVALAAAAWTRSVEDDVDLRWSKTPDSRNRLRYGADTLLGPDTLSLTTVAPGGIVTAYLSPSAAALTHTALMHELGVILGVPEGGDGVMATALSSPRDAPADVDVTELVALTRFEPADLTRDGTVDFYDLIALAEAFGATGVNLAGDLDGDGAVTDADVEALRQRYQFGQPQQPPSAGDQ